MSRQTKKNFLSLKTIKTYFYLYPISSLISLFLLYLLCKYSFYFFDWAILKASFKASSADECQAGGACWAFVLERLDQILYGFYPSQEHWRVNLFLALTSLSIFYALKFPKKIKGLMFLWIFLLLPILALFLLCGTQPLLPPVESSLWGGILLTFIVALTSIIAALPFGTLLALGRQSKLRSLRYCCIAFIELWRGVPLITVLFMSSVMLPLFLPEGLAINKLLRALIAVSMFASAYMAEVIRGGLQAIALGQKEASLSLGLSYFKTMRFVILPQAYQHVIPGIVNTFIGLFKDTTLVSIIGMFDLLGIIQAASTDPEWLGHLLEGYLFAAFFYWIICFSMSRYSHSLELKLRGDKNYA